MYDYPNRAVLVKNQDGVFQILEMHGIIPSKNGPFLSEQIFDWDTNKTIIIKLNAFDFMEHSNFSYEIDVVEAKGKNVTGLFEIHNNDELRGIGEFEYDKEYEIPINIKNLENSTRIGKSTRFLRYGFYDETDKRVDGSGLGDDEGGDDD